MKRESMGIVDWLEIGRMDELCRRSFEHTGIIGTHDLEMAVEVCSRVIGQDGGKVVVDGPTRDVLNGDALVLAHGLERPHILRHSHPHEHRSVRTRAQTEPVSQWWCVVTRSRR